MPELLSIQVGQPTVRPKTFTSDHEKTWESAIFKTPVSGPVHVGKINIDGDRQSDLKNHGGVDKAILAYAVKHYDYWRKVLSDLAWVNGAFGENLTVSGITEWETSIGDVYQIGTAVLEVAQPRQPCWKVPERWQQKDLALRVEQTGFTGWYLRVLQEGEIEAGMAIKIVKRPYPQWTISRVTEILNSGWAEDDPEELLTLAENPLFASERTRRRIKAYLRQRLEEIDR